MRATFRARIVEIARAVFHAALYYVLCIHHVFDAPSVARGALHDPKDFRVARDGRLSSRGDSVAPFSFSRGRKRPRRRPKPNRAGARRAERMAFGGPPFAVPLACVFLACVDVAAARRVVRSGENAGGPAPQGYGELDETTFITVMAFVGLGVVFCALASLSRRGASRLARLDAQLAAARGVRSVEAGDFESPSGCVSEPCAVGDVVSLIRRGVRVEGTGVVTRADARRDSYRVRWSRELSDTFTYRPVAGGPLLRARRRPGPKRGWRREDLLPETRPAAAAAAAAAAPRPSSPVPSASALEGLWVATWHALGEAAMELLASDPEPGRGAELRVGVSRSSEFELALRLVESSAAGAGTGGGAVARLRALEGAPFAASATVHLATGRLAMELGDADAFFDGIVRVAPDGDGATTVTGGWLGADGTFGAGSLRRIKSVEAFSFEAPFANAERSPDGERFSARRGNGGVGGLASRALRTPSGARARFRALAHAARTHGLLTTLRAGTGASLVANQDDDETVEDDEG